MLERLLHLIEELSTRLANKNWDVQSIVILTVEAILLYVCGYRITTLKDKGYKTNRLFQTLASYGYRLTFHSLAKYPGPLFSKLSSWSIFSQARSGNRHLDSWKEHEVYGEKRIHIDS